MSEFHKWSVKLGGDFNLLVFTGTFVLVALAAFIWALSFRRPSRPRHHHHHSPKPASAAEAEDKTPGGGWFARRRHKHRRKQHRPINPTLAQTGGLPAPRDPKTPPKSPL